MSLLDVYKTRCNTRFRNECESCSGLFHRDAVRIGYDGLNNRNLKYVKVTATLPSSGPLHFHDVSHPCGCGTVHEPDSPILGTPVKEFDYDQYVRRNFLLPTLITRTLKAVKKEAQTLRGTTDVDVRWFGAPDRRGVGMLHIHMVIALDLPERLLGTFIDKAFRLRSGVIESVFRQLKTTTLLAGEQFLMQWGSNILAEVVTPKQPTSIEYVLKTLTAMSPFMLPPIGMRGQHVALAQDAAHRLIDLQHALGEITTSTARSRHKRTDAGWTGKAFFRSRNWSVHTLTSLREGRASYVKRHMQPREIPARDIIYKFLPHHDAVVAYGAPVAAPRPVSAEAGPLRTSDGIGAATRAGTEPCCNDRVAPAAHRPTSATWICIEDFVSRTQSSARPHRTKTKKRRPGRSSLTCIGYSCHSRRHSSPTISKKT
ncbi:replication initiator [Arthrobacter crystallopoietes]